jgi:saccharopine dehydrogenase-like NADP-dependent oxidoreductase
MGLLADDVLKGVKNVDFKYGGASVELSELLYNMGLLSQEPVTVKGTRIVPMDLVLQLCPPAPKSPSELKAIIDEGVIKEEGAFLVRVEGQKDRTPLTIDRFVHAPGLIESFEKAGLSHETFLTGQCAAVFVKMLVEDVFSDSGVFVPEQLDADARRYYFEELAELGVTVEEQSSHQQPDE